MTKLQVVRLHERDTKCDAELTMIGEKESPSCRLASTGPLFTWENGKTENLTEDRWHTGQDWNCAPRERYTKPCGL